MAEDQSEEKAPSEPPQITVDSAPSSDRSDTINALDLACQTFDSSPETALNPALSGTSINSNEATNSSPYEKEINRLRELIKEKDDAISKMETRLNEVETAARSHSELLNQQFSAKLEESIRSLKESSQRDKTSMVMKYVEGEKRCIELNRHIDLLQAKLSDSSKEKQRLCERLEAVKSEMEKLNAENDKRLKEIMIQKKEIERLKEQLVLSDAKEKTSQLRLAKEIEAHALVQRQLEQANSELCQLKNQENSNEEIQRLQSMEQERKQLEVSLGKYKETLQSQKQMNKDLLDEILQLREAKETLAKEQHEKKQMEAKIAMLTSDLSELQSEMKSAQEKQGELLAFTAKLTEKNTQLQSENTNFKERLQQMETELSQSNYSLKESNQSLREEVKTLKESLSEKSRSLANIEQELDELRNMKADLSRKLADERNEVATLKKKHAANIKDLTRQIQALEKKQQHSTVNNSFSSNENPTGKQSVSREDSQSSLSNDKDPSCQLGSHGGFETEDHISIDSAPSLTAPANLAGANRFQSEVSCDGLAPGPADDVYVFDFDKQKLIEKIVKLQKKIAKCNEKIDFLQDHVNQLTEDSKRKTRIIQAYAMNEETGAFTSEAQDAIKREMSKKTGIMSTLYNTNKSYVQTANFIKLNESNMTMELCLEINAKLQALLEDTLIKNLTLKESLETLGTEIARLSQENRKIKQNL